ncbi:hypothetical protein JCM5353_003968, partial [Sporobolomyces roseus]
ADTAQLLFSGPSPLLSDHALVFSFNSDATDIPGVDKREANVQVLHLLNCDIKWRSKHSNFWPLSVNGPGKVKDSLLWTFTYSTVSEFRQLEKKGGVRVWNAAVGGMVKTEVLLVFNQGDTVAQAAINHLVGARGKCGCFVCTISGFTIDGGTRHYPAHLKPRDLETDPRSEYPPLSKNPEQDSAPLRQIDLTLRVGK